MTVIMEGHFWGASNNRRKSAKEGRAVGHSGSSAMAAGKEEVWPGPAGGSWGFVHPRQRSWVGGDSLWCELMILWVTAPSILRVPYKKPEPGIGMPSGLLKNQGEAGWLGGPGRCTQWVLQASSGKAQQEAIRGDQKHTDMWANRCKDQPQGWDWRPRPVLKEVEL